MFRLSPILLLIGCASRQHLRVGDLAAEQASWADAYASYERAVHARPGSVKARAKLAEARTMVLGLLDRELEQTRSAGQHEGHALCRVQG